MPKKGDYEIPFDKDGNQLSYPWYSGTTWQPNAEFEDTLTFESYGKGRSAVTFRFLRTDGKKVNFFISDFTAMVDHMHAGKITGRFTFRKQGENYGCYLIEPATPAAK